MGAEFFWDAYYTMTIQFLQLAVLLGALVAGAVAARLPPSLARFALGATAGRQPHPVFVRPRSLLVKLLAALFGSPLVPPHV